MKLPNDPVSQGCVKRRRHSPRQSTSAMSLDIPSDINALKAQNEQPDNHDESDNGSGQALDDDNGSISISASSRLAGQTVTPFLAKHIPDTYAPLGSSSQGQGASNQKSNTKYCYRHRPDIKCRRQADEPSMEQLQSELETLSQADRQGIAHVWSLFSAAPPKQRKLMLQGILTQCCFPQLSFISASVRELIRIDFLTALPPEISFKILCYLDTTSLCKAAQVSQRWRSLADDDVVWHRMCEQHIDRKCTKCGWGLPLLERKRLRASKRQIQLRATGKGLNMWSPDITPFPDGQQDQSTSDAIDGAHLSSQEHASAALASRNIHLDTNRKRGAHDVDPLANTSAKRPCTSVERDQLDDHYFKPRLRPWKDVYKDRFKVGTNWKYGRCSTKIFKGHSNGVMCLQFDDNILATGSYDSTIKIWDVATGKEMRTLRGHESGIRCLQFDDTKLISGSIDRSLKIWNWRTGECISTYTGHSGGVISLHFDSTILASGSMDKTIKIWNFEDKSTFLLRGHTDWVNSVKLDSVSRTVFSASDDCTVRLWDLDTKSCIKTFHGHVGQVQQVLPLPAEFEFEEDETDDDNDTCSTSSKDSSSDAGTHHDPNSGSGNFSAISAYGPGFTNTDRPTPPRYMLTGALDSTIRLWDVRTGRCLRTFFGHVEGIWALAADTLRVISGAEDRMVKVWDARTGRCERTFTGHRGPVTCIGLSDSRMCTGGEDCEVRLYSFTPDTTSGKPRQGEGGGGESISGAPAVVPLEGGSVEGQSS